MDCHEPVPREKAAARGRTALFLSILGLLVVIAQTSAQQLGGRVIEISGSLVKLKPDAGSAAKPGDKVEIFFEIPGLNEKALVATGLVTEVQKDFVLVKVDRSPGKIAVGQQATFQAGAGVKTAQPADAKELQRYRDDIGSLNERIFEAFIGLSKELEPLIKNEQADPKKLTEILVKSRSALKQFEADFAALKAPDAPAARRRKMPCSVPSRV
jgi:hypothetical protein